MIANLTRGNRERRTQILSFQRLPFLSITLTLKSTPIVAVTSNAGISKGPGRTSELWTHLTSLLDRGTSRL